MILEFGYFCAMCFSVLFYKVGGHLVLVEVAQDKYIKWRRLNRLASTQHTNRWRIMWVSIQMLCHAMYLSFIQYMNSSVRIIDKNNYEVSYVIAGKLYRMIVTPVRGRSPVLQVISDDMRDITDYVVPYLGPKHDWHSTQLSPQFFRTRTLTFSLSDGREVTYADTELTQTPLPKIVEM